MPLDYQKLVDCKIPDVEQHFTQRDTMLYALGVGLGADPCDEQQLQVRLRRKPRRAAYDGDHSRLSPARGTREADTGITRSHVVHGEQGFTIERRCRSKGRSWAQTEIEQRHRQGQGQGRAGPDPHHACATRQAARSSARSPPRRSAAPTAGSAGRRVRVREPHALPDSAPDLTCELPTLPQAALIYRLSGDYNPLHADPAYAKKAGFKMPILHGRCTFSVAGHALLKTCCGYDAARFKSMEGRFSSPVYPGETIRTEMWVEGRTVSFRSTVPARNVTVLNNGLAEFTGDPIA